ncbi:MAG: tRNA-dihydrouridine synthase family protein [Candidatus ainarchaeum sp.]|nr:tRNA-dihydrouridine synthase family protein [Candidatus ainarchaeum sp.]
MKKFPTCYLAPISEYTHRAYRELCKKRGAEFTFAPLINTTQIIHQKDKNIHRFIDFEKEKKVGIQLFGSRPEEYPRAIERINTFEKIKWLDVNAGCPMPKITKIGAGSRLLTNQDTLIEILKSIQGFDFTKSVKIRLLKNSESTKKLVEKLSPLVDVIIIHGRTPEQRYSGTANWDIIKEINETTDNFIIGNGDIQTIAQGKKYIKEKYCDGFMIGREAMKNPWLFSKKDANPKKIFFEYYKFYKKYKISNPNDLKQKAIQFFHSFRGAKELRSTIGNMFSEEEIVGYIKDHDFK